MTPYRAAAYAPPRPSTLISQAVTLLLLRAVVCLSPVLGVLLPYGYCSPETPVWARLAIIAGIQVSGVAGACYLARDWNVLNRVRRYLALALLGFGFVYCVRCCALYDQYDARDAALPARRYSAPTGMRVYVPNGSTVTIDGVRYHVFGDARLITYTNAPLLRCYPTDGRLEENVAYTHDCAPEAR